MPKSGARATVGILLDTTDELADITKTEVRDYILRIQQELMDFMISVHTMDENGLDKARRYGLQSRAIRSNG